MARKQSSKRKTVAGSVELAGTMTADSGGLAGGQVVLADAVAPGVPGVELQCPLPTDPAMGDKTPAVIAWWQAHHPEEYARRYANRIHPQGGEGLGAPVDTLEREERGPVSDFEDEPEVGHGMGDGEVRVIMG